MRWHVRERHDSVKRVAKDFAKAEFSYPTLPLPDAETTIDFLIIK